MTHVSEVLDGYKLFRTDRQGRCSGLALCVREWFDCLELMIVMTELNVCG